MSGASSGGLRPRGPRVLSGDIARLNGALAANVRFRIVQPGVHADAPAEPCGAAGLLVARSDDGRERSASSPLAGSLSRRTLLLQLSECLAECAMRLELGTAVYRATTRRGEARGAP